MQEFMTTAQQFVAGLPDAVQFLGVAAIGMIPFVESYGAATVGVATGVPVSLAILAAIAGNLVSVLLVVFAMAGIRGAVTSGGYAAPSRRRGRVVDTMARFGIPGAALLGPIILPSQLTSAAMVGAGANRRTVAVWTSVAVVAWGLAMGLVAAGVFSAAGLGTAGLG